MGYPLAVLVPETAQLLLPIPLPVPVPIDPRMSDVSGRMTLRGSKSHEVSRGIIVLSPGGYENRSRTTSLPNRVERVCSSSGPNSGRSVSRPWT